MANIKKKNLTKISHSALYDKLIIEGIVEKNGDELFLTSQGNIILGSESANKDGKGVKNPYLSATREWDLRYGSTIDQNHRLWIGIFFSWAITLLSLCGMYSIAHQKQVDAIFFAVDKIGRIIATGNPSNKLKISQDMMQQQMQDYIIALRSFSSDPEVNKRSYDKLKAMTAQNMATEVDNIVRENAANPNLATIVVDITSFNPLPNSSSYQIEWTENRKAIDGTVNSMYYRATLTLSTFIPSDPNIYYVNPLGILITQFDIFKLKAGA
ncbi:MAG: hypothetical protein KBD37_00265 [Burkholderiales bacterium]|nr:hypothetical protein [Burkholderiales bacterium]